MALHCLILLGEQRSCGRRVNPQHCTTSLQSAPCTSGVCELSHLPSPLAAVQLIWVAWDLGNPPDAASSRVSPAVQQPCQGNMQHSTKDCGISALDESATGILSDVTQHHGFLPSSPFITSCQDWSRGPGSCWACSLPAAACCRDNTLQSQKCQESILLSDPSDTVTQSLPQSAVPDAISCSHRQPNQRG